MIGIRRAALAAVAIHAVIAAAPLPASADALPGAGNAADCLEVSVPDLVEHASKLDGSIVRIEGEAIGPPMIRGGMAWVNIADPGGAIGIWMTAVEADRILNHGSYSEAGDILRVTGEFHRACREHGGDLDIHATAVAIARNGYPAEHPLSSSRIIAGALCAAAAVAMVAFLIIRSARERPAASRGRNSGYD